MGGYMNKLIFIFCFLFLSGCTQVVISDKNLIRANKAINLNGELKDLPLNIDADMDCHSSYAGIADRGVALVKIRCSNHRRINIIATSFAERGYKLTKTTDSHSPTVTLKVKELNKFLEGTTGFFNILTLGILPLYHHEYYTATYKSPISGAEISKEVKIYSTSSWVSLFLPNSGGLSEDEIKSRAEENLVRALLDDAKL